MNPRTELELCFAGDEIDRLVDPAPKRPSLFTTGRSVFLDPFTGFKTVADIRFELERKLIACLATGGTNGYPIDFERISNHHFRDLAVRALNARSWSITDLLAITGDLEGAAGLALNATLENPVWGQSDYLILELIEHFETFQVAALTGELTL